MKTTRAGAALAFFRSLLSISLAAWLALVVSAGLSAAIIFPEVRALGPTVPAYSAYTGEHWRFAAGVPANAIFAFTTIAQLLCAALAVVSLLACHGLVRRVRRLGDEAACRRSGRSTSRALLSFLVAAAVGALAVFSVILWPRMGVNFDAFLAHAKAGEVVLADAASAAFRNDHPLASRVLTGVATALAGAILLLPSAFERRA